ncbi:MAG: tetratricopeptide (TPR) repeat protein [Myxococcota bacterium]|jgi:tetratricopeptide (TPR) repeat protein
MGLLSWLFPSPEDRVVKARKLVADGRHADARYELLDNAAAGASELLREVENHLARLNLNEAVVRCRLGDDRGVQDHVELASNFHAGGLEEEFKAARRELRTIRADRSAAAEQAKRDAEARLLAVDPLGITGGPSWLDPAIASDLYEADRDEMEARLGLLVENYPEDLRERVRDLGAPFAKAVLDLDDGRPDLALPVLLELSDDDPLVCWERARVAMAMGDSRAAARSLRHLGELLGGHRAFGQLHSGALLAQMLAETGDVAGGLRVLRNVRSAEPKVGGPLFAALLEANGDLKESESVLVALLKDHPGAQTLYGQLARVRLKGGHRKQAMRALEASFAYTCGTPGRCGYQPPDLANTRMLATLYLEDGVEIERASELADKAASLVKQPTWDDAYLRALTAKRNHDPEAARIVDQLRSSTPEGPQRERVDAHLPG